MLAIAGGLVQFFLQVHPHAVQVAFLAGFENKKKCLPQFNKLVEIGSFGLQYYLLSKRFFV
jgi:hypothetical protein